MVILEQNKESKTWYVVALKEEFYMPDVNIVYTGVGKVKAAIATQKLIDLYHPEKIINVGTAGCKTSSLKFKVLDVSKIVERDFDTKDGTVHELQCHDGGVCLGTGDSFVECWEGLHYDIVDMEGYAIGYACQENNIDFKCFKMVSDTGNMNSWEESLDMCNKTFGKLIKDGIIG